MNAKFAASVVKCPSCGEYHTPLDSSNYCDTCVPPLPKVNGHRYVGQFEEQDDGKQKAD